MAPSGIALFALIALGALCNGALCADEILYAQAKEIRIMNRDIMIPEEKVSAFIKPFEAALKLVDQSELRNLSDEDVENFFEMSSTLSFYTNGPNYTVQMRRAYDELQARGIAKRQAGVQMRDQYVASRMFTEAHELTNTRPDLNLKEIPVFELGSTSENGPGVWRLTSDGKVAKREPFDLSSDGQLIVVASPWCSFSQKASAAISNNGKLSELMRSHSTWIVQQSMIPDFDAIVAWNNNYPGRPLLLIDKDTEWPWIPSWYLPGFYFMKQGKIVTSFTGWPGEERIERLLLGFESIGFSAESSPPK